MDWNEERREKQEKNKKEREYKEVEVDKSHINYPPCIDSIMKGLQDGRKRALFILLNYFKSLNFTKKEIEGKIETWNKLNKPPLKEGYIRSQLEWTFRQGKILPPNCDKDYYKGIGVCTPEDFCLKIKNPVNYTIKKSRWKK